MRIVGGRRNVEERDSQIKVIDHELYPGPICAAEVVKEAAHSSEPSSSGLQSDLGSRLCVCGGGGRNFLVSVVTLRADRNTGAEKLRGRSTVLTRRGRFH